MDLNELNLLHSRHVTATERVGTMLDDGFENEYTSNREVFWIPKNVLSDASQIHPLLPFDFHVET